MCSIAGGYYFSPHQQPADLRIKVAAALALLQNRGPDEASLQQPSARCVMGGNRLIIRGAPGTGSMPFENDGNLCWYNGEIYNYRRWCGHADSDGAAVLAAFAEGGASSFADFDGEFAISIWDSSDDSVVLCRDPFGTKPLYFSLNRVRLLWASSASAIHAMEAHERCRPVRGPVTQHTTSVQEPYTSFAGIWSLPPGHVLIASPEGVRLRAFHHWDASEPYSDDVSQTFDDLEASLVQRLTYDGTVAIPMSGGIDSGIIAFFADRLGIPYHIFSVVEMFGHSTEESAAIERRLERLRNPAAVSLLKFGEEEYRAALSDIYLPDYYDYETFDNGNLLVHAVCAAVRREGLRVLIDGSGGDELFHGYKFRADFGRLPDWPYIWDSNPFYYSIFSTLLAWTAKTDRAGGHFSIESRFPYQSVPLMRSAALLRVTAALKWPLRAFLLERTSYGPPLRLDIEGKLGFSVKNRKLADVQVDMLRAWHERAIGVDVPLAAPRRFPGHIGGDVFIACEGSR